MPVLYVGQYEWTTRHGDDFWQPPGGDQISALDLRSLPEAGSPGPVPQGAGVFVYDTPRAHPSLLLALGSDVTATLTTSQKAGLRALLKLPALALLPDTLTDLLRQCLMNPAYYDATGLTRWKPVLPDFRRRVVECRLPGVGALFTESLTNDHPAWSASRAVFQADYLRHRTVHQTPLAVLQRWVGSHMLRLWGAMSDDLAGHLLPAPYQADGWTPPATAIADNFNRTDESLDVGPWVETVGDWAVTTNEVSIAVASFAAARHTTALSTDDHKAKVTVTALTATTGAAGALARMSTDATPGEDYYVARLVDGGASIEFTKTIDNAKTVLDTSKTVTISLPDDVEIEVDGSTMISRFNGTVQHNFTDTSLTGQLNAGMHLRRTGDRVDDFSAEDVVAAAAPSGHDALLAGIRNQMIQHV